MAATPSNADFDAIVFTANSTTYVTNERTFVSGRLYIMLVSGRYGGANVPTSVVQTDDSNAWTPEVSHDPANTSFSIWSFVPGANDTDDVTITFDGTCQRCAVHIIEYTDFNASTPTGVDASSSDTSSPADLSFTFNADGLSGAIGGSGCGSAALSFTPGTGWVNDPPNDLDTTESLSQGGMYAVDDSDDAAMAFSGSPTEAIHAILEIRGPAAAAEYLPLDRAHQPQHQTIMAR